MTKTKVSGQMECKDYRPMKEYSNTETLIDNLPYIAMTIVGAVIILVGSDISILGWVFSILYILYAILGALWIMIFICPYCYFFNTRACPCGYGIIAVKFNKKKSIENFAEKFKKHIPVIVPLWLIPVLVGGYFLFRDFNWLILTLILIFSINSFIILPLVSKKYGCAHCQQRDTCPWMKEKP